MDNNRFSASFASRFEFLAFLLVCPGTKPKLQAAQKSLSDPLSIITNRPFRLIWELLGLGAVELELLGPEGR